MATALQMVHGMWLHHGRMNGGACLNNSAKRGVNSQVHIVKAIRTLVIATATSF